MVTERKTQIARFSQKAWQLLQKLPVADSPLPVALNLYAGILGVRVIRFKRILSDAGLASTKDGFEIVINSNSIAALPEGTTLIAGDGTWSQLAPQLRFRVAHELAHVIMLNAAQQDRQSEIFTRNEKAVENACNILARIFLLPRHSFVREIDSKLFQPAHIDSLVSTFQVAPEVLIRRFHLSDMQQQFANERGFLGLLEQGQGGKLFVKACHIWGDLAQQRFDTALRTLGDAQKETLAAMSLSREFLQARWIMEGKPLSNVRLTRKIDIDSLIRSERSSDLNIEVDWSEGRALPCRFAHHISQTSSSLYFVSLQIKESIIKSA